jgi:hypothetical protein
MNGAETLAARDAGKVGGKFLDSIGKYNLIELTKEEWTTFIQTVCSEYAVRLNELLIPPENLPY